MNINHYNINNCRLFSASDVIEETGIAVTNASVITRMLGRYCPEAQTAKDWREAGAELPDDVRPNKRMMTEQQVARYLEHVPRACCPELHDFMFEVYEYFDNTYSERRWDHNGIVYEYSSEQREAMVELHTNSDYQRSLEALKGLPGVVIGVPVAVERKYRDDSEFTYDTKYEVPAYDTENKVAHYFITTDRMTEFEGYSVVGTGAEEMKSREFEELKKVAALIEDKLGCSSEFHIIKSEDAPEVFERDGSYFYMVDHVQVDPFAGCPF